MRQNAWQSCQSGVGTPLRTLEQGPARGKPRSWMRATCQAGTHFLQYCEAQRYASFRTCQLWNTDMYTKFGSAKHIWSVSLYVASISGDKEDSGVRQGADLQKGNNLSTHAEQ